MKAIHYALVLSVALHLIALFKLQIMHPPATLYGYDRPLEVTLILPDSHGVAGLPDNIATILPDLHLVPDYDVSIAKDNRGAASFEVENRARNYLNIAKEPAITSDESNIKIRITPRDLPSTTEESMPNLAIAPSTLDVQKDYNSVPVRKEHPQNWIAFMVTVAPDGSIAGYIKVSKEEANTAIYSMLEDEIKNLKMPLSSSEHKILVTGPPLRIETDPDLISEYF